MRITGPAYKLPSVEAIRVVFLRDGASLPE